MRILLIIAFFAVSVLARTMPIVGQDTANGTIPKPGGAAYLPLIPNSMPPTATPTPTLTPTPMDTATPAPTLTPTKTATPQPLSVGTTIKAGAMRIVVEGSYLTDEISGYEPPQGGIFLVVLANVTNEGLVEDYVTRFDVYVKDSKDRQFQMSDLTYQWAAQDAHGREGVYHDIGPSFSADLVFVWEIARDSTNLSLILR